MEKERAHTIYLPPDATSSGIDIHWNRKTGFLEIGGWYDNCVEIKTTEMPLKDFLGTLGIGSFDCEQAFQRGPVINKIIEDEKRREKIEEED